MLKYSKTANSNKHLTLEERIIIFTGLKNESTFTAIGDTLGKDNSTIGKEVKLHRFPKYVFKLPLECTNFKKCRHNRKCTVDCPDYVKFTCKRRDRSPGVCDGCSNYNSCRFTKYSYDPVKAHNSYREELVDSRSGVNMTSGEAKKMAEEIKPMLDKGLSPYAIQKEKNLGICEKTLYNYIDDGIFSNWGINNACLRQKTSRKISKPKKGQFKKREDHKFLIGRTYNDYVEFVNENPDATIVQMDTVYNDGSNGPFIQTFKFISYGFLFGIYHDEKTAEEMLSGLYTLEKIIGFSLLSKEANLLVTDRGSEFYSAYKFEITDNGEVRTRVFYCDPMCSWQKGGLENMHKELRYILPKGTDLRAMGLVSQEALNLALSHINSAIKEGLHHRSPFQVMKFFNPELAQKFADFGISEVENADDIILRPYLLKPFVNKAH